MTPGLIFDIKRYSIHDGPGIRTTVFFKGCPLECWWCHNPESQSPIPERMFWEHRCIHCGECEAVCPHEATVWIGNGALVAEDNCVLCGNCVQICYAGAREIVGRWMTVEQVMAEVERDVPFFDQSHGGVTLSGGEPLFQPDFLRQLLVSCREQEIHTALDTCGYAPWEVLDSVRNLVNLFLYDLKLIDNERHRHFTGVSNQIILRNLQSLAANGHNIRLRVPLIPGVNDDEENLNQIASFAAGLPLSKRVDLLPYHYAAADKYYRLDKPYRLPETPAPDPERVAEIRGLFEGHGLQVNIGG